MFFSDKNKSFENHWFEWVLKGAEREQLYYDVRQLVEDMVKEIVPQEIEKYFSAFSVDVETRLNGKAVSLEGLKADIERLIIDELTKRTR